MRNILDDCMRRNLKMSAARAQECRTEYVQRLQLAHDIFGDDVFEIPRFPGEARRKSIALQDAVLVACDRLWDERGALVHLGGEIQAQLDALAVDEEQGPILIGRANTAQAIKDRLDLVETTFKNALQG